MPVSAWALLVARTVQGQFFRPCPKGQGGPVRHDESAFGIRRRPLYQLTFPKGLAHGNLFLTLFRVWPWVKWLMYLVLCAPWPAPAAGFLSSAET